MTQGWYRGVLADIHDSNYSFLARAAAASAVQLLPPASESGVIVDLGCGSGVTAEILDGLGYSVVGIDASADMIALARKRVPTGHFRIESIYEADIPDCQAVLAIGEVFNYETEDRTSETLAKLLHGISRSLHSDGFLLCDIAEPGRASTAAVAPTVAHGDCWTMEYGARQSDDGANLRRTISIDVRPGWRSELLQSEPLTAAAHFDESHDLALIAPADFRSALTASDLDGTQLPRYDGFEFPSGWSAWLARPMR